MSINWVMLDEQKNFIPLPKERILYTSPARTTFSLTTPNTYPGKTPLSIQSNAGKAFITTQRLIYLPASTSSTSGSAGITTTNLQSFAAPLLNIQDAHVTAPFFGPNAWLSVVRPVTGGGIPATHAYVELKVVFKDGGAFDFHSTYERVKEQVRHAVDVARESGGNVQDAMMSQGLGEELPAYEGPVAGLGSGMGGVTVQSQGQQQTRLLDEDIVPPPGPPPGVLASAAERRNPFTPPNEDPPGYEDVQRDGIANSLEEMQRRQAS